MKNIVEISVIIPVYNVEKYLKKCIDSVLEQEGTEYEIILVDDGSTDSSSVICDKYGAKYENIFVIHKENEGLGYARNSGIDLARGEYIFFLDSDDWIVPDTLKDLKLLVEKYEADMVCFAHKRVYDRNYRFMEQTKKDVRLVNNEKLMKEYFTGMPAMACCKMYRKEIFSVHRFSKVPIHEDAYSMHLFLQQVNKAVITNQVYYIQYIRSESLTQSRVKEKNFICVECGERIVEFSKQWYPELLEYAYYNLLERQIYMIDLIISHFQYKKFSKQFKSILMAMKNELEILEDKRELNAALYDKAENIINLTGKYVWLKRCDVSMYLLRIKASSVLKRWGLR